MFVTPYFFESHPSYFTLSALVKPYFIESIFFSFKLNVCDTPFFESTIHFSKCVIVTPYFFESNLFISHLMCLSHHTSLFVSLHLFYAQSISHTVFHYKQPIPITLYVNITNTCLLKSYASMCILALVVVCLACHPLCYHLVCLGE